MKAISINPRSGQQPAGSNAVVFLHGHQLERNLARAVTAEAAGTFVLVLAITSAAVAAALSRPVAGTPYGSLAVQVAGGLALATGVASVGHISGAHLNPAVTLGLAASRRFPWAYAPGYFIAQFTGAIAAAAVTWGLYGDQARAIARLGSPAPAAGVSAGRVLAAEAVVTFVLVLVIVAVATDTRVPRGIAAMAIGGVAGAHNAPDGQEIIAATSAPGRVRCDRAGPAAGVLACASCRDPAPRRADRDDGVCAAHACLSQAGAVPPERPPDHVHHQRPS
jgi:aquaporin Z/aquaporin NIP